MSHILPPSLSFNAHFSDTFGGFLTGLERFPSRNTGAEQDESQAALQPDACFVAANPADVQLLSRVYV